MKTFRAGFMIMILFTIILLSLSAGIVKGQEKYEFPFNVIKLSKNILFIRQGETDVLSNTVAVNSGEGIVVMDAGALRCLAERSRKIISDEFSDKNISYVINFRSGLDHCFGNHVYSDASIIGHESWQPNMAGMLKNLKDRRSDPKKLENTIKDLNDNTNKLISGIKKDSYWKRLIKENLRYENMFFDELKSPDFNLTFYDITFRDRLTIKMNKITLLLISAGAFGEMDDIILHIPELKLLHVGQVFSKNWLPKITQNMNITKFLDFFNDFFSKNKNIKYVTSSHGDLMTKTDIKNHLDYIKKLWAGIQELKNKGTSKENIMKEFSFDKFDKLNHIDPVFPLQPPLNYHERNISSIIKILEK